MIDSRGILGIPYIGEEWPEQGGLNVGLMKGEIGLSDYFLIAPICKDAEVSAITWGEMGHENLNAKTRYGAFNTRALTNSPHLHAAAQWASSLAIGGFNDFFLPSRNELMMCWLNVPHLFQDKLYWSSSEFSKERAWCQHFADGDQDDNYKVSAIGARAVRRVYLSELYAGEIPQAVIPIEPKPALDETRLANKSYGTW